MQLASALIGEFISVNGVTYTLTRANNGDAEAVSCLNEVTMKYLRHSRGTLVESFPSEDELFLHDSSFIPVQGGEGVRLHCANPGLRELCLSLTDNVFVIAPEEQAHEFRLFHKPVLGSLVELGKAKYRLVKANNGRNGAYSFLDAENGLFLRHANGVLTKSCPKENEGAFFDDSSFTIGVDADGYVFHCTNPGLEQLAIKESTPGRLVIAAEGQNVKFRILGVPSVDRGKRIMTAASKELADAVGRRAHRRVYHR